MEWQARVERSSGTGRLQIRAVQQAAAAVERRCRIKPSSKRLCAPLAAERQGVRLHTAVGYDYVFEQLSIGVPLVLMG